MPSAMIGNLAVSLTMNTAAFQRGATIAEKRSEQMRGKFAAVSGSLKGIGAAIGAGVIVDGLSRMVMSAVEMGAALSESAEKVGVTVEELQRLRFAAEQSGIGADKMDATIKRLNKSLGDLQLGKSAAVEAFAAIGLSADDLRGKSPEQALKLIADQLNKLPDAATRVAVGQQIMGKGFSELLPLINGGAKAIEEHGKAAERNGIITEQQAKDLDVAADAWDSIKNRATVATAGLVANGVRLATELGGKLRAAGIDTEFFNQSVYSMATDALLSVQRMVAGITTWVSNKLSAIWDGAIAKIKTVKREFYDLWTAVTRKSYVPDMVDDIAHEMGPRLENVMVKPALEAVKTVSDAFMGLAQSIKSGGFLDILGSVINLGLQLGGIGAFGKTIAGRINGMSTMPKSGFSPGGSSLVGAQGAADGFARGASGGSGTMGLLDIRPSPLFDVYMDGKLVRAAPAIASAGGNIGLAKMKYSQSRKVG